jgi:hypothetical protein
MRVFALNEASGHLSQDLVGPPKTQGPGAWTARRRHGPPVSVTAQAASQ